MLALPRSRGARVLLIALALLPLLLAVADDALARAGGGHSYGGGGGGGSHSSGGGSHGGGGRGGGADIGWLLWALFRLIVWSFRVSPFLGIAVLGGLAFLVRAFFRMQPGARTGRAIQELDAQRLKPPPGDPLAPIRARDPALDRRRFQERVVHAFVRAQEAWSAGDLRPIRPFVTDAVWSRFSILIDLNQRRGRRNLCGDVRVERAEVIAATAGDDFDEVHVRIQARGRDVDVPAGTSPEAAAKAVAATEVTGFVEIWSFLRRAGTATRVATGGLAADGSLEGSCPSCAAPVPLSESAVCTHCGSLLASGTHDWTLAEITQESAFTGAADATAEVPGLSELRRRDPGASRQAIEDRASLVFWRWLEARVTASPVPLRKLAAPSFMARLTGELERAGEPLDQLAVGSADLALVETADGGAATDGGVATGGKDFGGVALDRVHVRISWDANQRGPRTHVLVLARRADARSTRPGLASASCSQCGAPLPATDSPSCDYCGAELAAKAEDWTLEAVLGSAEWASRAADVTRRAAARSAAVAARAVLEGGEGAALDPVTAAAAAAGDDTRITEMFLPDPAVPMDRERLLRALIRAAAADGSYARGEVRLLRGTARRFAIAPARLKEWMDDEARAVASGNGTAAGNGGPATGDGGGEGDGLPPGGAATTLSGPLLVRSLVTAALVDGRIDRREKQLLRKAAERAAIDAAALDAIIARETERVRSRRAAA